MAGKGYELTALRNVLALLTLSGRVLVSLNAPSYQLEMATQIVEQSSTSAAG